MIEHEHPEIVLLNADSPESDHQEYKEKCKQARLELLQKEQIVPPCVMYPRD